MSRLGRTLEIYAPVIGMTSSSRRTERFHAPMPLIEREYNLLRRSVSRALSGISPKKAMPFYSYFLSCRRDDGVIPTAGGICTSDAPSDPRLGVKLSCRWDDFVVPTTGGFLAIHLSCRRDDFVIPTTGGFLGDFQTSK